MFTPAILIIGWYATDQRRVSFVRLLEAQAGLSRRKAFDILNSSLSQEAPIILPVESSNILDSLVLGMQPLGVEFRVVDTRNANVERIRIRALIAGLHCTHAEEIAAAIAEM